MKKTISILTTLAVASAIFITGCNHTVPSNNPTGETVTDSEMVTITADVSKLSYDMEVGKYEVTRAWLKSVLGDSADVSTQWNGTASEGDARPADNVTKKLAAEFCNKLSQDAGLAPYYTISGDTVTIAAAEGKGYRLPTADEWMTLAKAGTENRYSGTNGELPYTTNGLSIKQWILEDDNSVTEDTVTGQSLANAGDAELAKYAWTKYNLRTGKLEDYSLIPQPRSIRGSWGNYVASNGYTYKENAYGEPQIRWSDGEYWGTHKVGTKLPNAWNLYDMTGNVSELIESGEAFGGDIGSNTVKIDITGSNDREAKVTGFRVVRTK